MSKNPQVQTLRTDITQIYEGGVTVPSQVMRLLEQRGRTFSKQHVYTILHQIRKKGTGDKTAAEAKSAQRAARRAEDDIAKALVRRNGETKTGGDVSAVIAREPLLGSARAIIASADPRLLQATKRLALEYGLANVEALLPALRAHWFGPGSSGL